MIDLRGQKVTRSFQLIAEKTDLFRLGFQVPIPWVGKHKIEDSKAPLDVFDFVLPPVANVLAVDLAIEPAGEQVVDDPALWEAFGAGVLLGVKLVPESGRALAPMGVGEGKVLTRHKVARMRRNDVEKASFRFGVAEGFQRVDMDRRDGHGVVIRAGFPISARECASEARRRHTNRVPKKAGGQSLRSSRRRTSAYQLGRPKERVRTGSNEPLPRRT
jgi:hypothetical protein